MGGSSISHGDYSTQTILREIENALASMSFGSRLIALGITLAVYAGMSRRGLEIFLLFCAALAGVVVAISLQNWAWGFLSGALVALLVVELVRSSRR